MNQVQMMGKQESFNKAYLGVLKQGKPSIGGSGCRYRTDNGTLACGVGQLIEDEYYKEEFDESDDTGITFLLQHDSMKNALRSSGVDLGQVDQYFLARLQRAHDEAAELGDEFIAEFKASMVRLATTYNLVVPTVPDFTS